MNAPLKIIFFGTPDFVTPILQVLSKNFEIVAVVTAPDHIEGRKKILTPSPVKTYSLKNIPDALILTPEQFNNQTIEQLQSYKPNLFVVAAYGKILPVDVLNIPKYGSINVHPSLLPKYRGPSPIQSALLNGDDITGVSIILMDHQMDHGSLLSQWEHQLSREDTFESLHVKLFQQAADRLPNTITEFINGEIKPVAQNDNKATYCKKITKEDGYVEDLSEIESPKLDRMVRAFYPWPTVWTRLPKDFGRSAKKGTILKLLPGKKIQLEGKNVMNLKDVQNGYPSLMQLLEPLWS